MKVDQITFDRLKEMEGVAGKIVVRHSTHNEWSKGRSGNNDTLSSRKLMTHIYFEVESTDERIHLFSGIDYED